MKNFRSLVLAAFVAIITFKCCISQQSGSFNFAKKTAGERDGDLTPSAIAGVSIACVAGLAGLVVTMFFCYYVYRQQRQQDSLHSSFVVPAKI